MKKIFLLLTVISLSLTTQTLAMDLFHKARSAPQSIHQEPLAKVLKTAMASVVNVNVEAKNLPSSFSDAPSPGSDDDNKLIKLGSGVIVRLAEDKAYIVTNAHVISDASIIDVTLNDDRRFTATKIGEDKAFDLAVLEIKTRRKLPYLSYGDSNAIEVGEAVSAIGSPFGFRQSASTGIVSAKDRDEPEMNNITNYIQTDAPINPGNSGGALIDNNTGKLIGINTWIVSKDGGNLGIGFAIPSNIVKAVVKQIIEHGNVEHGHLGIMVQSLTPELVDALKTPIQEGAIITDVKPNTPAAKAGLKTGDIIIKFNNEAIHSSVNLVSLVSLNRPDSTAFELTLFRDGKEKTISNIKTLSAETMITEQEKKNPYLFGTTLRNYNFSTADEGLTEGVKILAVDRKSNAANAGLEPGDIIVKVNQQPIKNINTLDAIVKEEKGILLLTIDRDNGTLLIPISRDQPLIALGNL